MLKLRQLFSLFILLFIGGNVYANPLPEGFVYLKNVAPTIIQEIRYGGSHNFIGRPIKGYETPACILTKPAAMALSNVQKDLNKKNLSLKVFDCYRPQIAVDDFIAWSKDENDQKMKAEFYPFVDKSELFNLGYIASKSGHTRGSTTDLTIVSLKTGKELDMGTNFDYMDPLSHNDNKHIGELAYQNRMILKDTMEKYGFAPYEKEWWHFTLKNEPYPDTYFNFPIKAS